MRIYYNEIDPFAIAWLHELMKIGALPKGEIDTRSIKEVQAHDLKGFDQAHFFAGIGGWPYALHLAGWGNESVWTASCPCQPFSCAGQRKGDADERHLWPAFYPLIAKWRPPVVFGEQVASPLGREWLAGVRADMETTGYAFGAANLPAACKGAPHKRQRLYWLANANSTRRHARNYKGAGMGHGHPTIPNGHQVFWDAFETHEGDDRTFRRSGPSILPLAHGIPNRMGTLRGAGNAIVPQVAAEFIKAYLEIERL